jgi:hypothetical protein
MVIIIIIPCEVNDLPFVMMGTRSAGCRLSQVNEVSMAWEQGWLRLDHQVNDLVHARCW